VPVGFSLAGLGLALVIAGAAVAGVQQSRTVEASNPPPGTRFDQNIVDSLGILQRAEIGLLVSGSLVLVAGVTIGALGAQQKRASLWARRD
jgi:hypothetical protein